MLKLWVGQHIETSFGQRSNWHREGDTSNCILSINFLAFIRTYGQTYGHFETDAASVILINYCIRKVYDKLFLLTVTYCSTNLAYPSAQRVAGLITHSAAWTCHIYIFNLATYIYKCTWCLYIYAHMYMYVSIYNLA